MTGADRHARAGFLAALLALPRAGATSGSCASGRWPTLVGASASPTSPAAIPAASPTRCASASPWPAPWSPSPQLLLLDEPASGLSADEMDELGDLITSLTDRMSVLLVEHHMDLVMAVCDEITVLDFGRVIARGTPDEVRNDPAVSPPTSGRTSDAQRRLA